MFDIKQFPDKSYLQWVDSGDNDITKLNQLYLEDMLDLNQWQAYFNVHPKFTNCTYTLAPPPNVVCFREEKNDDSARQGSDNTLRNTKMIKPKFNFMSITLWSWCSIHSATWLYKIHPLLILFFLSDRRLTTLEKEVSHWVRTSCLFRSYRGLQAALPDSFNL